MGDPYWNRQAPPINPALSGPGLLKRPRPSDSDMDDAYRNGQGPPLNPALSGAGLLKQPRPSDYDLPQSRPPSAFERQNYLAQDRDRGELGVVKDTKSIGSAYDRYLQSMQFPSMSSGEANSSVGAGSGRSIGIENPKFQPDKGLIGRHPIDAFNDRGMGFDNRISMDSPNGRDMGYDGRLPPEGAMLRSHRGTVPLPSDASNTLYVEGLPPDCTKREVAHIFRPFVGYKEVRLVSKESRYRGEPLVLCFVDFNSPACAATAMSAVQGYKMDEHDSDSQHLRIQFSKHPGPRSSSHGKR